MIRFCLTLLVTASMLVMHSPWVVAQSVSGSPSVQFVRIDPGKFVMGTGDPEIHSAKNDVNLDHPYSTQIKGNEPWNEEPAHWVQLTEPFEVAKHEVTVGLFKQFVDDTGYVTDAEKNGTAIGFDPTKNDTSERMLHFDRFRVDPKYTWRNPGFPQQDDHPVVCVSWNDATAFCKWLSERDREGQTYRLPTEAEWEYVAKAGTNTWYSFGNDPDKTYQCGNVADAALEQAHPGLTEFQRVLRLNPGEGDGVVYTAAVGSFKANPWEIHDVHGNVWEWVQDKYEELEYQERVKKATKAQAKSREEVVIVDPTGPEKTSSEKFGDWRVIRGGGWNVSPISCRSGMRAYGEAGDAFCYTGFRLVRSPE